MLLMCWVITCLSSTMTCLLFCGAEAQYWGGGAWGRKDAFNDEIPMWLEDGGLHPWRKKIDCKHPERNDQFCLLLSSIVLLISALTVMCIQENCLFLLDMAGTSEACEVSSTRNARGGREKISPHSTENAYTQICKVRHSKGKDKRTCMYVLCMFVNLNVWVNIWAKDIFVRYHSVVGGGVSLLGAQRLKPT